MIITPADMAAGGATAERISKAALDLIGAIFSAYPEQVRNFAAGVGVMVSVQGRDMNISLHKPFFPVASISRSGLANRN